MRKFGSSARVASPLPSSPTRGEVPGGAWGKVRAKNSFSTSPLVGEAGRGVATSSINEGEL